MAAESARTVDGAGPAPLWSRPKRLRLYSSARDAPRARRPTDVLLLLVSVLAVALLSGVSADPGAFGQALVGLAESVPAFLDVVWVLLVGLLSLWVVTLAVAPLVRRRGAILRDVLLASAGVWVLVPLLDSAAFGGRTDLTWASAMATAPPPAAVSVRLAVVAAVTVVSSPHLTRPFRSVGRWVLGLGAVSLVVLGATTPSGAAIGLLCGAAVASVIHLLLGSSGGRPPLDDVRDALLELGVPVEDLAEARLQTAGMYLVEARDPSGASLVVKVFGRDAWDAQVLTKAWRALWYRDASAFTLTRLQQAEHEAFVNLLAARNGVPVDEVVRAGRSAGNDALVVLRHVGRPVREEVAGHGAEVLAGMWDTVLLLGRAEISHGDLGPDRFALDGDRVVVSGLGGASVAPSGDQRRIDVAQLVVTTALLHGEDAAVATASQRLGPSGLRDVAPYLQVAALGRSLRAEVRTAGLDVDALRARVAEQGELGTLPMARLRRVSPASLVRVGLAAFAAVTILTLLVGIDYAEVIEALSGARWGVLVVALVVGQVPRFAQALGILGACPRPLPYGPVVLLQFAIAFVSLVLPATPARVAVNVRFLQKQGIPPASAMSVGLIDSLGGFAAQVMILVAVLTFGVGEVSLAPTGPEGDVGRLLDLLIAVVVVALAAVVVALAVPSLRRRIGARVRPWVQEVRETVASLRSPAKVVTLLGGNLLAELLLAATLGVVLLAFDTRLSLATLAVVIVCVELFSGLMPVPGSIGVAEGALVLGLTAAGVDEATAFAAAISYRLVTFYLPPIWGGAALRRLERDGLL